MENKKLIGIKDRKGNDLYEWAVVRHKSIEGQTEEYVVKWSDYRNQWIGDCPTEIYDLSADLLSKSELVTNIQTA